MMYHLKIILVLKDYLHLFYQNDREIIQADTHLSASNLDLYLDIHCSNTGRFKLKLYITPDDFDFPSINLPILSGKIQPTVYTFHNRFVTVEPVIDLYTDFVYRAGLF